MQLAIVLGRCDAGNGVATIETIDDSGIFDALQIDVFAERSLPVGRLF